MGMTLEEIRELNAYELASTADCASPDTRESAGAAMLTRVRNGLVEAIESGSVTLDNLDDSGQLHEIADGAPSVYTHHKWEQFLDLCAYQEEPNDGEWPTDLDQTATIALYQIADRLVHLLAEDWRDGWECPTCGDSEPYRICSPDDCRFACGECGGDGTECAEECAHQDDGEEEGEEERPADPFRGHPDYAGEDWQRDHASPASAEPTEPPVSDPILDLIVEAERAGKASPGDETAAFLARMDAINSDEFGDGRRYRTAAVVWAVGWLTLAVGVVGTIVWGLTR